MARRGEYIRKRVDERWEGRYKYCLTIDGKWKYRSVYGKTYTEVKEKLNAAKFKHEYCNTTKMKSNSFSNVLLLWLKSIRIKVKPSTETKYLYMIERHIVPVLGCYRVSDLNATLINSFLDMKLKEGKLNGTGGLAPSYVQSLSVIIISALQFAVQEELCLPFKSPIYKPSLPKPKLRIFSKENQLKLEDILVANTDEIKLGILIALLTGLRIGEICALQWADIDFEKEILHVNHTVTRIQNTEGSSKTKLIIDVPKTRSSLREIPIPSLLMPVLKSMHIKAKSNFVVSTNEDFVSTRTFDYRYRQLLRNYNVEVLNFQSLRHTFATKCVAAGVDVKTLSEILGHANVSTTLNIYVHPSLEMKKAQLEKLFMVS